MARNIEIKAKIERIEALIPVIASLADTGPFDLPHHDTFFNCPSGKLKLRAFSANAGELIYYQRPELKGPKLSIYQISPTNSPDSLRNTLASAYGILGTVRKRRTLYLLGNTRFHLDHVDTLGDFLELEVVLSENQTASSGESFALELMAKIGVLPSQLISTSYLDLLHKS
ncbi:MAG: CYTH domain-containing protein [Planctomycetota bacterium]|jgi:predicted adenylyl cyclase CyaB|nr:MAG: CYTH domain-containing protein [Planctomycetota bacterium]